MNVNSQVIYFEILWLPIGDLNRNFSRQFCFSLAMATKMVAAWSAAILPAKVKNILSADQYRHIMKTACHCFTAWPFSCIWHSWLSYTAYKTQSLIRAQCKGTRVICIWNVQQMPVCMCWVLCLSDLTPYSIPQGTVFGPTCIYNLYISSIFWTLY